MASFYALSAGDDEKAWGTMVYAGVQLSLIILTDVSRECIPMMETATIQKTVQIHGSAPYARVTIN
jgi:hypothetical protein